MLNLLSFWPERIFYENYCTDFMTKYVMSNENKSVRISIENYFDGLFKKKTIFMLLKISRFINKKINNHNI